MKLGIVGSRGFNDYQFMVNHVDLTGVDTIVSGGARGADSLGAQLAKERGLGLIVFPADWKTHGVKAGFLRNTQIVEASDQIIAFWDGTSRGTMDTVSKARAAGKPVTLINYTNTVLDF